MSDPFAASTHLLCLSLTAQVSEHCGSVHVHGDQYLGHGLCLSPSVPVQRLWGTVFFSDKRWLLGFGKCKYIAAPPDVTHALVSPTHNSTT